MNVDFAGHASCIGAIVILAAGTIMQVDICGRKSQPPEAEPNLSLVGRETVHDGRVEDPSCYVSFKLRRMETGILGPCWRHFCAELLMLPNDAAFYGALQHPKNLMHLAEAV